VARRTKHPAGSPLDAALERVGDRWTLLVAAALMDGPARFSDLAAELPAIAPNILTQRLRRMEQDGLVISREYSSRPPRHAYELTTAGRELQDAVNALSGWGAVRTGQPEEHVHAVCGTPLAARWYCTTCEESVNVDAADDEQYV
jgi:DNA-binding HxlR family transcriptional regulator